MQSYSLKSPIQKLNIRLNNNAIFKTGRSNSIFLAVIKRKAKAFLKT